MLNYHSMMQPFCFENSLQKKKKKTVIMWVVFLLRESYDSYATPCVETTIVTTKNAYFIKMLPGAMLPQDPAMLVQLDESGLKSLAVPKSDNSGSKSWSSNILFKVTSWCTIGGEQS